MKGDRGRMEKENVCVNLTYMRGQEDNRYYCQNTLNTFSSWFWVNFVRYKDLSVGDVDIKCATFFISCLLFLPKIVNTYLSICTVNYSNTKQSHCSIYLSIDGVISDTCLNDLLVVEVARSIRL